MEKAGRISSAAQREHHVPELADRRVSEHPFDVILRNGDAGGEDRGKGAEGGNHAQGVGAALEDGVQPGHHEHTRGHHRGGVNERRYRGRALHGVGQPHVKRELAALPNGPAEEEKRHQGCPARGEVAAAHEPRHLPEIERARENAQEQDADEKPEITEAVHDESLLRGAGRGRLLVPEPDQEVGAKADQLPGHIEKDEVVRQDEREHGKGEKREVGEEPAEARIPFHVAQGVDLHQEAHGRDDHEHESRQGVDQDADVDADAARVKPGQVRLKGSGPGELAPEQRPR